MARQKPSTESAADRVGDGPHAKYFNTPDTALFLDEASPRYVGGILIMLNARLFKYWHDLPEALRTGQPQNETKHGEAGMFETLYADPAKLEQFLNAMTGLSRINFEAFAERSSISPRSRLSATWAARPACSASKPPNAIRI